VTKEGEPVGVEGTGRTGILEQGTEQAEMLPSGVGSKGSGHNASRVVIECENEHLESGTGPPSMRGGIMLVEFANPGALPAAPRFGAAGQGRNQSWKTLPDISGHRSSRAAKIKAPRQLISQQGKV